MMRFFLLPLLFTCAAATAIAQESPETRFLEAAGNLEPAAGDATVPLLSAPQEAPPAAEQAPAPVVSVPAEEAAPAATEVEAQPATAPSPFQAPNTLQAEPAKPVELQLPAEANQLPEPKTEEAVAAPRSDLSAPPSPFVAPDAPAAAPLATAPTAQVVAQAASKDTFTNALTLVYASNPQLKAQRESLKATDEGVMQALSGALPNASASYDRGRERVSAGNSRWKYGNSDAKGLNVSQNIFNGGETYASFKAAQDRVKAGQATLRAIEQQVLYDAVLAYTDVVEKQLVLEVNQKNVDVLGRQLEATQARFNVGDITRTDVAQAEARLAKAKSDERQALGDLDASRATYKRVIGTPAPEKLELPNLPSGLPESLDKASEQALAEHPNLEALKHIEAAAEKNVDVKTAALLPDVSVNGSMSRGASPNALSNSRAFQNDAITLNVSIPLYQSGAEWSRIREAKNQASEAKYNTMDTRNAVIENAHRAWQDYNTAKAVIVSSGEALHAAEVALEGITQENQSGLRTILDVLDTEQQAFNARLNLVKAERAEKTLAYRLLAAVGHLTARDLKLPTQMYDPAEHYDDVKYKLIGLE